MRRPRAMQMSLWTVAGVVGALVAASVSCGGRRGASRRDRLLEEGRRAWKEGDLHRAERLLKRALRTGRPPLAAARLLARIQRRLGRPKDAEESLTEALGRADPTDPDWYPAVLDLARLAADLGRWNRAAALLGLAIERYPKRPQAYWALARLYEDNEQWQDAGDVYRRLVQAKPGNSVAAEAMVRWARAESQAGRRDEARKLLERALSLEAVPPRIRYDAHVLLGAVLASQGHWTEARRHLRAAVQLLPHRPRAWALLGRVLLRRAGCEDALHALEQAGRQGAVLPGRALSCLYRRSKVSRERLLDWARRSVEARPEDLQAAVVAAQLLVDMGHAQDALALLEHTPDDSLRDAGYWIARARALAALDRHREAFEAYSRAVAVDPGNDVALRGQALEAVWSGRYGLGVSLLGPLLSRPGLDQDPELLLAMAAARLGQGRLGDAERWLAKARKHPGSLLDLVRVYEAWLALERGRPHRALAKLAGLQDRQGPYRLHALDVAARALVKLGRFGEARRLLEQAVRSAASPARRAYFRARLERVDAESKGKSEARRRAQPATRRPR